MREKREENVTRNIVILYSNLIIVFVCDILNSENWA